MDVVSFYFATFSLCTNSLVYWHSQSIIDNNQLNFFDEMLQNKVPIISFLFSCEREELVLPDTRETSEQFEKYIVQDTTYTDEELSELLDEEWELISNEKKGFFTDISHMDITKENPKKVYVHYMPWFQNKSFDGYWGQHWTMNSQNPEIIDNEGKRQIASYYYPTIGPYSSNDPDLHEYHLLLMKLSGIDGVIFDWYGSKDLYDYGMIKKSTETFIHTLEDLGLTFSIMYEDRAAAHAVAQSLSSRTIEAAQEDFEYINEQYFSSPNYMKFNDKNMLFVFGPHYLTEESQWDQIFSILPPENKPDFLTLWAASDRVGLNASGEFLWVDKDHLLAHEHYYGTNLLQNKITVGSSYPGFKSFYQEGGWTEGINEWEINTDNGNTFVETLNYTHHEQSDFIQIITWNDFGEGTMIEPTLEFGFMYLQILQSYTGVEFTSNDLQIALDLYRARKKYDNNEKVTKYLNRTYKYIKLLKLKRANKLLVAINRFF